MANILVPTSAHDISKLGKHVQILQKFGGLENHSLTYLVTPTVKSTVEAEVEPLRSLCPNLSVHSIDTEPQGDKTRQCNYLFFRGAQLAAQMKQPWLWMELDAYPVKKGWADKIAVGYATINVPFAGHLVHYEVRDANGRLSRPYGDMDKYMMGVGMYPANAFDRCRTLINDFSKGGSSATESFDVYLKSEISLAGMAHFPMIHDQCRTHKFRMENGELVCTPEDIPENWPTRRGKCDPSAYLIHGCKDDSLADLILASGPDGLSFGSQPAYVAPQASNHPQSGLTPPNAPESVFVSKNELSEALERSKRETVSAMAEMMRDFLKTEKTQIKVPEKMTVEPLNEPEGIWPVINRKLSARKWKLPDLAKAVQLPEDQLLELLSHKGYETHTGLKWIKEKEQAVV